MHEGKHGYETLRRHISARREIQEEVHDSISKVYGVYHTQKIARLLVLWDATFLITLVLDLLT